MLSEEQLEAYSKEYYNVVYKYCMKYLGNKEDAEDATQTTFLEFSKKHENIISEEHIKPWIYAVAKNIIMREYTKRKRKLGKESVFDEELFEGNMRCSRFEDGIVDVYGEKFEREIYESMSPGEREIYDLYTDDLLKPHEKAKILGISGHASSMKGHRLKERFRDKLKEKLFY